MMAPVCAQLTYCSLGVLVFHHAADPGLEVNVSAREELVELCKRVISSCAVAEPLTHCTSFAAKACSQEWPYLAMMSENR